MLGKMEVGVAGNDRSCLLIRVVWTRLDQVFGGVGFDGGFQQVS